MKQCGSRDLDPCNLPGAFPDIGRLAGFAERFQRRPSVHFFAGRGPGTPCPPSPPVFGPGAHGVTRPTGDSIQYQLAYEPERRSPTRRVVVIRPATRRIGVRRSASPVKSGTVSKCARRPERRAHPRIVNVAQPSTAASSGSVPLPGPVVRWIRAARPMKYIPPDAPQTLPSLFHGARRRPNPQARTPAPHFCQRTRRTVRGCAPGQRMCVDSCGK